MELLNRINTSIDSVLDITSNSTSVGDLHANPLSSASTSNHLKDVLLSKHLRNIMGESTRVTRYSSILFDPIRISEDVNTYIVQNQNLKANAC